MMLQTDSDIRWLVEKAYRIFPEQKFRERLQVCSCNACVSPWDELPLRTSPRRGLSAGLLETYLNSADPYDEKRKGAEFRHFLPRIFELAVQEAFNMRHCLFDRLSNAGEGLGGADFRNRWSLEEIEIVDAIFDALFSKRLTLAPQAIYCRDLQGPRFPSDETVELYLYWKARSLGQISDYLSQWEKDFSYSATLHIAAMISAGSPRPWASYSRLLKNGHLSSPFWDDLPEQESLVASWLLAPQQIDRLERLLPFEIDDQARWALQQAILMAQEAHNLPITAQQNKISQRKTG